MANFIRVIWNLVFSGLILKVFFPLILYTLVGTFLMLFGVPGWATLALLAAWKIWKYVRS